MRALQAYKGSYAHPLCLVIINEGRVLLMLRYNELGKDLYYTPGGRVFNGELLDEAVAMILRKETS